jgi:hypothetical protein
MTIRSFLFVPADSERKFVKASGTSADALILDLEDSVAQENLPKARPMAREFLGRGERARQQLWVRVNPLETPLIPTSRLPYTTFPRTTSIPSLQPKTPPVAIELLP